MVLGIYASRITSQSATSQSAGMEDAVCIHDVRGQGW
jgi:hypothetical protein